MCGICGVISAPNDAHRKIVQSMSERLRHRGPDAHAIHESKYGVLGHQRLAVIDLEHGGQPMVSPDGRYVLVYNGEIYNYIELRQKLIQGGQQFRTFSDTEVLLWMLIQEGAEALPQLNGMFAFFFLDTESGEWLMARDPFGIKPLYYTEMVDGTLAFASEIKALLVHPGVSARLNTSTLQHYIALQYCLGNETLFEGIQKLLPGHCATGRGPDMFAIEQYWDASYAIDEDHTEQYFVDRLRFLLQDSARLQIRSDVPLGAYLSGGLDSSTVASLAAEYLARDLPVFNGKFLEPGYDESRYAREVASHIGANIHEIVPTEKDFVETMPKIIWALDEPVAGPGAFPQYLVSRVAAEQVKVVLGGQGGDEIFGGYARYLVGYLEQALKGAIFDTQEEGNHIVSLSSIIPNLPILRDYQPLMKGFWHEGLFEDMDLRYFRLIDRSPYVEDLLTDDALELFDREDLFAQFQELFNHPDTHSYINKMTRFDTKTLLPALLHVEDRMSMAVSLESRVPLLDTRIMELVASTPPAMKFRGGETKALLKRAVEGIVPDTVLARTDKMGFPVPLTEWSERGITRDFMNDTLLSQASLQRGIYRPEALKNMVNAQGLGSRQLWGALSLELWHQTYIDGQGTPE